jgi:cytochrome d ubiquinol oxidase subunit I
MTTEIGRQPWVVYGLLRTENAVSNHSAATVSATLAIFVVMYVFVFGTGLSYMLKIVAKGPHGIRPEEHAGPGQVKRAARPLSAAPDNIDPAISK